MVETTGDITQYVWTFDAEISEAESPWNGIELSVDGITWVNADDTTDSTPFSIQWVFSALALPAVFWRTVNSDAVNFVNGLPLANGTGTTQPMLMSLTTRRRERIKRKPPSGSPQS